MNAMLSQYTACRTTLPPDTVNTSANGKEKERPVGSRGIAGSGAVVVSLDQIAQLAHDHFLLAPGGLCDFSLRRRRGGDYGENSLSLGEATEGSRRSCCSAKRVAPALVDVPIFA